MIVIPKWIFSILKLLGIYNIIKFFYKNFFAYSGIVKNNIQTILFYRSFKIKKNFLDVGCFEGSKIDIFLNIDKEIKVIAFEPFKKYYFFLKKKYKKKKNIKIINKAISNKNLSSYFYYNNKEIDKEAFSLIKSKNLNHKFIVKNVKLDEFYSFKPGIIKIDTEGAELKALKGCKKILNELKPIFFVEVTNKSFTRVKKFMSKRNYKVYIYEYNFFKKQISNLWRKDNVIQNDHYLRKIYHINNLRKFKYKKFMFNIICFPSQHYSNFKSLIKY